MLKRIFTNLIWICTIFGLACNSLSSKQSSDNVRKIADKTTLNENWLEISPVPPLEATDRIFFISLKIKDVKARAGKENTVLELNNGDILTIEVELIDENGQPVKLFLNGIGEFVEFGKRSENKENIEDSYFQKGAKFNKLRVRSNKPVTAEEIVWAKFEF